MLRKVTVLSPKKVRNVSFTMKQNRSNEDYGTIAQIGDLFFYAVYDGHGKLSDDSESMKRRHVVVYLKDYFHHYVADAIAEVDIDDNAAVQNVLTKMTMELDSYLHSQGATYGSTICAVLQTPKNFYVINLGDSAALFIRDKKSIFRTKNHHPDNTEERKRIIACGGQVTDNRVDAILAMSRSLGDFDFKRAKSSSYKGEGRVSCRPDVTTIPKKGLETIVIATDGLFCEGVNDSDIIEILSKCNLKESSYKLYEHVKDINYNDDTTVMVIHA